MCFEIKNCKTEYMKNPIGMDCHNPRFSWQLVCNKRNTHQVKYRIIVGKKAEGKEIWDSGDVFSDECNGVVYSGICLEPCTKYYWTVKVQNNYGEISSAEGNSFETGMLNPAIEAWNGAKWIGASEYTLCSDVRGVFGVKTEFEFEKNSTYIGIIIGAEDKRIKDTKNYFRFDIDASRIPARLKIYRVGILNTDSDRVPLADIPVTDYDDSAHLPVINTDNIYNKHCIDIKITGNCCYTAVDGKRIDVMLQDTLFGKHMETPRQINPFGANDVNTYPRLNKIGFFIPKGNAITAYSQAVYNLRKPNATVYEDKKVKKFVAEKENITAVIDPSHTSIPMLRTEFEVKNKSIRSARLYATARGIYECQVNGKAVTDTWFNPGETQYDRHLMYQTYDVEKFLHSGKNAIGVILASGWWDDAQTFVLGNFNYYGDRESFLGKIQITYADGTFETIVTEPETWKYSGNGPWTYAGFFNGEHYDARRKMYFEGFSEAGYDDSRWVSPEIITTVSISGDETEKFGPVKWPDVNMREPELIGQIGDGVREAYELTAKAVTEPEMGVFIYDMGVNAAGVPCVRINGEKGQTARLRYAEMLYPDLPEFDGKKGQLMVENLRDADCTDLYTFSGDTCGEDYTPRFTFRGYRYIEVSGVSKKPSLEDIKMKVLSSVPVLTGSVEVSELLINRFMDNVRRSQQSNFISIPTDCPQRNERMGWDGDTAVFTRAATFNADTRLFYVRWLQSMRDLQEDSGKYPDIAPVGGGFGGYTYESSAIMVTYELFQQYGDVRVVMDNMASMQLFMDYSAALYAAGKLDNGFTLGDWLAPEETDIKFICEAFYGNNARCMSVMSAAIGKHREAQTYDMLYRNLRKRFSRKWFDAKHGKTKDDTQCSYALPIMFKMLEKELIQPAGNNLADKTKRIGYKVNTGFFGTTPLNPALTRTGHKDIAYKLISQTECPSWLYPVTQGATSVWERWDSYTREKGFGGHNNMNSFDHYSLGAVCEWFYTDVLGIRRDENCPGYKHFFIKPQIGSWKYAKGGFECPYGRIYVSWEQNEDIFLQVIIPTNTTATVLLTDGRRSDIGSGEYSYKYNLKGENTHE